MHPFIIPIQEYKVYTSLYKMLPTHRDRHHGNLYPAAYIMCNDAWIIILHENYSAHNVFDKFSRLLFQRCVKLSILWFFKALLALSPSLLISRNFSANILNALVFYEDNKRRQKCTKSWKLNCDTNKMIWKTFSMAGNCYDA